MANNNPEAAMTFGELLELIHEQQNRLTVLESAFSLLPFCMDSKASQLMIHSLRLEGQNQNHDEQLQQRFLHLADEIEKRLTPPSIQADITE